jgi:hypothetical protein
MGTPVFFNLGNSFVSQAFDVCIRWENLVNAYTTRSLANYTFDLFALKRPLNF